MSFASRWIFWGVLMATSGAQAGVDLEKTVVKVISSNPATSFRLNGSGFYFKYRDLGLVLTSEHILPPMTDTATKISMKSQEGGVHTLQLLKSDWGNGLALLSVMERLTDEELSSLPDLAELNPPAQISGAMISAGFPAASEGLVVDANGVLESAEMKLDLLLDVPKLIAVRSALTEFGMSGGLLLNEELQPLGTLSHKSEDSALTFVIPFKVAIPWIQQTIDLADFHPQITRKDIYSPQRIVVVNSGKFNISWRKETGMDMSCLREHEVSLAKNFDHPLFPRAQRLCDLYSGFGRIYPYVQFYGFRQKGLLHVDSTVIKVQGLTDFFRKLRDPSLQPVAYVYSGYGSGLLELPETRPLSLKMNQLLSHRHEYRGLTLFPYLRALMDRIDAFPSPYTDPLEPGLARLSLDDLDFVLKDSSLQDSWNQLRAYSAADAEQLEQHLQNLRKIMAAYVL